MTLVKWTPNRSIFNIYNEIEDWVSQEFSRSFESSSNDLRFSPNINVSETEENFLVTLDIPGVNKKDVDISICDGCINISGERKSDSLMPKSNKVLGKFNKSFDLNNKIQEEEIIAKYNNGVLYLTLPKVKNVVPDIKKVSIV